MIIPKVGTKMRAVKDIRCLNEDLTLRTMVTKGSIGVVTNNDEKYKIGSVEFNIDGKTENVLLDGEMEAFFGIKNDTFLEIV